MHANTPPPISANFNLDSTQKVQQPKPSKTQRQGKADRQPQEHGSKQSGKERANQRPIGSTEPRQRGGENGSHASESQKVGAKQAWQKSGAAPQGYVRAWSSVPKAACLYVDELLTGVNADTVHAFKHVLDCGSTWTDSEAGWVPIYSKLLENKLSEADMLALVESGLLEMKEHDRAKRRSREYRVPSHVRREYDRLVSEHIDGQRVNLYTSARTRSQAKCVYKDDSDNSFPELIRAAMRCIEPNGVFNVKEAKAHVDAQEAMYRSEVEREALALAKHGEGSTEHETVQNRRERAEARWRNDLHCLNAIRANMTADLGGGVVAYRVPYRPSSTGRVSFIGGGAQGCMREMKGAGYKSVSAFNYDIKSSQPTVLIEYLQEAGLPTGWLEMYLRADKREYAGRAGLSVDAWKRCLCALMMGASLPRVDRIESSKGELRGYVEDEHGEDRLVEAYSQFRGVVAPLYGEALKPWHDYLVNVWAPKNSKCGHGGKRYVTNAVCMSFCLDDSPAHELGRRLAAFLLQGREASFIHTLTVLSKDYGFAVVANEHDGLITTSEIPQAAIDDAKKRCGMSYVELVLKPFV